MARRKPIDRERALRSEEYGYKGQRYLVWGQGPGRFYFAVAGAGAQHGPVPSRKAAITQARRFITRFHRTLKGIHGDAVKHRSRARTQYEKYRGMYEAVGGMHQRVWVREVTGGHVFFQLEPQGSQGHMPAARFKRHYRKIRMLDTRSR